MTSIRQSAGAQKFSAPVQSEAPLTFEQPPAVLLFSASDAAREIGCHPSSVKRVAREMRLLVIRSVGGVHLFAPLQVTKIRTELERRRIEALK